MEIANEWVIKVKRLIICYEPLNMCDENIRLFYKVFSNKTLSFENQMCTTSGKHLKKDWH